MRYELSMHRALYAMTLTLIISACSQNESNFPADSNRNVASGDQTETTIDSANGGSETQVTGTSKPPPPSTEARGAAIVFEGRTDTVSNADSPIMGWAGSRIRIGFSGTNLSLKLNAQGVSEGNVDGTPSDTYIAVTIDQNDTAAKRLKYGTNTYLIAEKLVPGQHEVTVIKRTEGEFGTLQFLSATTDGMLTSTLSAPRRRIEVIGDSGATGWGAAGMLGDVVACATSAGAQDVTVSFASVAGKLLNAQVHNTSFAGKGLVQNRDVVNDSYKTMPRIWTRRLPNSPFPAAGGKDIGAWDPKSWVPDALVLVTSGNDFYANGGPSQSAFEETVTAFIKTLRTTYPASHVYLMVSPMLHNVTYANGGYSATARDDALAWCKHAISGLGDGHAHFLEVLEDNGDRQLSCDYHMTSATHLIVAKQLASALAADLGWSN
jgi:hypothetical protein